MNQPSLTFFCELEPEQLTYLFADGKVISSLSKLKANLSLGLLDFSIKRAEVVKKLNRAGIPVTAWILLPKEQGYWTSLDTIQDTVVRYQQFKDWATQNKLKFSAIGLDIEPPLETVHALGRSPLSQAPVLLRRLLSGDAYQKYEGITHTLIQQMHMDGFAVETYQFPTVIDERAAQSIVLSKTLGLTTLSADREVLMLYSSFFPKYSDSILWSYVQQAQAVGLGSTGGGVELEGIPGLKTLRWIDLKRDLLLAAQRVDHLYIFSLEGCVENKYMHRLLDLNWETAVIPPARQAAGITLVRKTAQGFLWALSHPIESFFGIVFLISLIKWLNKLFSKQT